MHFLSTTAVLLNLILFQEVAAIPAIDTLNVAAMAKCQQKPQNCPMPNDCSWGYTDAHYSCKAV
ncbi:hypothetical protein EG328_011064 [Venturia inaequalis]|uniref:Uncharacterized protein n=1 Tax=Venturia inaequalis TaxID=5025 RepID=A0A8H3Z3W7_VENIN|nr:hypothetical protein EG328_011064 [Venturia inaequalis]KAE9992204.1 hypothetical protein EG327_009817 [Venturia inaequalis]